MTTERATITFSPAEKAYLQGGEGNPYPEEKTSEPVSEGVPDGTSGKPENDKPASNEGKQGDQESGPDAEGEEEVEVADGTNPDGPPRRKMIAFGAYDKKRIEANNAKAELAKLREQLAYVQGLAQSQQKPQQPATEQTVELSDTPPDKTKEPEKYLAWLETAAQEAIRIKRQSAQQAEQDSRFNDINQKVYQHEQAFINGDPARGIEPHPDFAEALKFLQDRHKAELTAAGYRQHEIQQIMAARAQSVAQRALEDGANPAERAYELAKVHGYKKPAPVAKETEAEKIARQAKNQEKAGKTISSLPGGSSSGGLTHETLANMSPAEFQRLWNSGEAKKVMGFQ